MPTTDRPAQQPTQQPNVQTATERRLHAENRTLKARIRELEDAVTRPVPTGGTTTTYPADQPVPWRDLERHLGDYVRVERPRCDLEVIAYGGGGTEGGAGVLVAVDTTHSRCEYRGQLDDHGICPVLTFDDGTGLDVRPGSTVTVVTFTEVCAARDAALAESATNARLLAEARGYLQAQNSELATLRRALEAQQ